MKPGLGIANIAFGTRPGRPCRERKQYHERVEGNGLARDAATSVLAGLHDDEIQHPHTNLMSPARQIRIRIPMVVSPKRV